MTCHDRSASLRPRRYMGILAGAALACGPAAPADDPGSTAATSTSLASATASPSTTQPEAMTAGDPTSIVTTSAASSSSAGTTDSLTTDATPANTSGSSSPATTTAGETTTTETTATETTTTETTASEPLTDPEQVYRVYLQVGSHALDDVPQWEADPDLSCQDQPPPLCGAAPSFGPPKLRINGVWTDLAAVALGDQVAVAFPFASEACDLGCGSRIAGVDGGFGGVSAGTLPPDFPCKSAASGVWAAVDVGEIVSARKYTVSLQLQNACGAEAGTQLSFVPK